MNIIDAHIHTNFQKKALVNIAKINKIDFSLRGLKNEMHKNSVIKAVSITDTFENETPIDLDDIGQQTKKLPSIIPCVGINPHKITKNSIRKTEEAMKNGNIKSLKIFLGYYHVYANDPVYHPFYSLAAKYKIPVIIHTGDTLAENAKLKFTSPLTVDEVAVEFRNTIFIIAHLGNPWIEDAAAVLYKNPNVYADLSGLMVSKSPLEKELVRRIRNAFFYVDDPKKFLYGSDWPLVSMDRYIKFIKSSIPKKYHEQVFYANAKRLFKI
jgi:uncharacterized protein